MIGHFSYLDLPVEKRATEARRAREQIRTTMSNTFLTPDQSSYLHQRLARIDAWEHGTIVLSKTPPQLAQNAIKRLPKHSVDLNEGVNLDERIK